MKMKETIQLFCAILLFYGAGFSPAVGCSIDSTAIRYKEKITSFSGRHADSTRHYTDLLMEYALKNRDKNLEAFANRNYGHYHWYRAEFPQALSYYRSSLEYYESVKDSAEMGLTFFGIGLVNSSLNNLDEALRLYYLALKLISPDDKKSKARILNSIAIAYKNNNDLDSAFVTHNQAEKIFREAGDLAGIAGTFINKGVILTSKGDIEGSIEYQMRAYHLFDSIKIESGVIIALNNLGEAYTAIEDFSNAKLYKMDALNRSREANIIRSEVSALTGLGIIENRLHNFGAGEKYLYEAKALALQHQLVTSLREILEALGKCLESQRKYGEASAVYKNLFMLVDSLNSVEKTKRIENLKFAFTQEKKGSQIALLKLNGEVAGLQRNFLGAIIILLIVLVIGIIMRQRLYQQQRMKLLLEAEVQARTRELTESNALKDKLFSIIGHDLRSPINTLKSMLSMLSKKFISHDEFITFAKGVEFQVKEISVLMDNLLTWSKNQFSNEPAAREYVRIENIFCRNKALFQHELERKNLSVAVSISPNLIAYANEQELDTIIRNLLFNAIKFSFKDGTITLGAVHEENAAIITVQDYGMGMNESQKQSVFTSLLKSTQGTENEKGSGLGLLLCSELIAKNKGTIEFVSFPNMGTTFTIKLPSS